MSLNPYSEYKDSGVEWIGRIPASWAVKPLFSVASENRRSNKGMIENNLLSLSYGRIINKNMQSNDGLLPESFETYQVIESDDLVFRLTDLQNDKRSLRSAIVPERGIITSAYLSVRPTSIIPRFLAYTMRDADLRKVFYSMGGGLRQSMKFDDMKRLAIVFPSADEQIAIADFLDRETTEIDAFIADQEELIALLGERRAATITRAVTKGINPSVPLEESGIEWLGQVPRHWSIRGVKAAAATFGGSGFPHEYQGIGNEELPFHKVSALAGAGPDGVIRDSRDTVSRSTAKILGAKVFPAGTIVMAKIGAALLLGRMRSVDRPFCIDNNMLALVPNEGYATKYLIYALQIVSFDLIVNPGAVPSLDMVAFRNYPLAFPGEQEQQAVADFLDHEMTEIDAAIAEAREAIALSKERRAAVISAAVTGKIDVRGALAPTTKKVEVESVGVA